ncbi:MAG TPA: hypothetical protein VJ947_05375, partial [Pseudohaliea sp.]|nr:hypothetical protein [Pseudohaliea sp.]
MDSSYRRDGPGKSPMGMDLVPVYKERSQGPGRHGAHFAGGREQPWCAHRGSGAPRAAANAAYRRYRALGRGPAHTRASAGRR